jgi:hypothetical protein
MEIIDRLEGDNNKSIVYVNTDKSIVRGKVSILSYNTYIRIGF